MILSWLFVWRVPLALSIWCMMYIARNVSHDHHRKNKLAAKDSLEAWEDKLGSDENRSSVMQREEEMQLLSMAMDRLPEEKREILLLSKFQDKKYKEIGEILGCSEGAVKVKVFRALQDLKEMYQKLETRY